MTIIDRYIFKSIFQTTLIVLFVFIAFSGFIDFVSQTDDIGTGNYGVTEAIQYTILKLPSSIFKLLSIIVLIGSLLGLGNLSKNNELLILLSSGMTMRRLGFSVLISGFILCFLSTLVGEYFSPPMERLADQLRTKSKYNYTSLGNGQGIWLKEQNKIININLLNENQSFGNVTIFELNDSSELKRISRATSSTIDDYNQWILSNLQETIFDESGLSTEFLRYKIDKTQLDRDLISLTVVTSEDLNILELYKFIKYLVQNSLDAKIYQTTFHSRIASLLVIPFICLLALPLSLGMSRNRGIGYRVIIGMLIGIAYFMLQNTLIESAQIYKVQPILLGWIPFFILLLCTASAFRLVQWK